jgi:hypothetical protein
MGHWALVLSFAEVLGMAWGYRNRSHLVCDTLRERGLKFVILVACLIADFVRATLHPLVGIGSLKTVSNIRFG